MIRVKPLSDEEIREKIVKIISGYLPNCRIYLIGSRAKGTHTERSDYDVVIVCEKRINYSIITAILDDFDKLPTLKTLDLIDFHDLDDHFKNKVFEEGVLLYDGRDVSTGKI
ncbi:MAG: nucleotidyltransferase domain-containing protein [Thermotogae bacterium]|nr:nucleotidyltransferase domain-containing protein [Thermotogota bacterium]